MSEETLLEYLSRPNPAIVRIGCIEGEKSAGKSNSDCGSWNKPVEIRRWEEFDFKTMKSTYDTVLDRKAMREPIVIAPKHLRTRNETGVERVVSRWNQEIVCEALKESAQHYNRRCVVEMLSKDQAYKPLGPSRRSKYEPDWATAVTDEKQFSLPRQSPPPLQANIMPGDTKCSWNWESKYVEVGRVSEEPKWWMRPIRQIFTYCLRLKTRYGYLISDEELVVVRVGPRKNSPRTNGPKQYTALDQLEYNGQLEFKAIPWKSVSTFSNDSTMSESSKMSVNMALWWMHLQAATKRSIEFEYPALKTEVYHQSFPTEESASSSQPLPVEESGSSSQPLPVEDPIPSRTSPENSFVFTGNPDDPMIQSFYMTQRNGSFNMPKPKPRAKQSKKSKSSPRVQNDADVDAPASLNTSFASSTTVATAEPGSFSSRHSKRKRTVDGLNPKGPASGKRKRTRNLDASFTSQNSATSTIEDDVLGGRR